jgi:ubiquinone/menaquinone biosynthesis C-methylase UbiE
MADSSASGYALGSTDREHERLIWQAERLAPITERLFREAGVGPGQRVLDLGSGVGDVVMLAARLVGPSGEVVGIERDPRSIALARLRADEAGLRNVTFVQSDVSEIAEGKPFDAAVGRFLLIWLPDPIAALRSLARLVRPGGVIAFQEPDWAPVLWVVRELPLWFAAASLIHRTFEMSGASPDLGANLYWIFREAGLPEPTMRLEVQIGKDPETARWFTDMLRSVWPRIQQFNLPVEPVGDLDTLPERLIAEVGASKSVAAWVATVGAWAHK